MSMERARRFRACSLLLVRWCERALELGCLFSINPDAHSTEEIDNIQRPYYTGVPLVLAMHMGDRPSPTR
jgi:hypothetical protein